MSEPNSNAWPFTEISGEEGLDINAIFGDSTGVANIVLGGLYGRAAVDGVRHSPNHFGISTEADRTDHASFFVVIEHHRIGIGG